MANITKTKNGKYRVRIYLGRDDKGKQRYETTTAETLREARMYAAEYETKSRYGKVSANDLVGDVMKGWLSVVEGEVSPSTYMSYKTYVHTHFIPYFKYARIHDVTEYDIRRYFNTKKLSKTTLRKHFFVMRRIFHESLKGLSPFLDLKAPETSVYEPLVINESDYQKIIKVATRTTDELVIRLAGECGLRLGEICALTTNDLNELTLMITVNKSRGITPTGYEIKGPKSRNGIRVIQTNPKIASLFKKITPGYIVKMQPGSYSKYFKRLLEENDLPPFRFHDLRHYHATMLYKQGVPDHMAAQRLGHDVMILKKVYQQLQDDTIEKYNKIIKEMKS